jgi:folate-dependent tRNA-U54 methylase TrmFO/GidA
MNVNFGLFPPLADASRRSKKRPMQKPALSARARADLEAWAAAAVTQAAE